jgi:thiamine-monophosphate kinase
VLVIPVSGDVTGSISGEGEFALIRRITARLTGSPDVLLGPGDDAAVVAAADGRVVASTDLMVEGRHFRRDWSTAYDVGRKAAAANLADIVAMGARPTALLVGLAAPADLPIEWVDELADGLRDEASLVGASIVGGDLVACETLTIAVTALGDLEGRAPVTRSGAAAGDSVVLIGWPGRAAAGLAALEAGRLDGRFVDAHRRPTPPYDVALALARSGNVTAMIDISDGLLADTGHLARASNVQVEIDAAHIPLADGLAEEPNALDLALTGGDDHCFVATTAMPAADSTVIGRVVALGAGQSAGVTVIGHSPPPHGGHEHWRS